MLKKAGIVRRTFLFVALLIVIVTLVSFAILYFAMPSYYLYKKQEALKIGTGRLEQELREAENEETCAVLITDFSEQNNAMVLAFDSAMVPIIRLSTPYLSLTTQSGISEKIVTIVDMGNGEENENESEIITFELFQDNQLYKKEGEKNVLPENRVRENYRIQISGFDIQAVAKVGTELVDSIWVQGTLQPINESRDVLLSLMPYVLAAGSAIGLCSAWIYARQITKPILKLSAAAVRMKHMEPDAISGLRTKDELGLLSENLDALYQSLSETIASLKEEMEKVNRLERFKTEMMQSASHELKTPVAALSGMLDGMLDEIGVYKDKDKYLLKCRDQVEKLSFLVKEILDASRADTKELSKEYTDNRVDDMITCILAEFDVQIREKKLQVYYELSPVTVRTDSPMLYRVIANLISNGVRYTPEGGSLRILLDNEQLVIENECLQIPPDELERLFEPFYTRSSSRDRSVSGTGLGLYIVKRNLEKLSIPYRIDSVPEGFRILLFWNKSE